MKHVFFLIGAILITSLPCYAAHVVNIGGLRKVSATLEPTGDYWKVEVGMIPVRCFTPSTNKKITRSFAKRYAMTALAVHFKKKVLSAKSCVILSESGSKNYTKIVFQIADITSTIPQSAKSAAQPKSAAQIKIDSDDLSSDLLNRKNDWINTLTSFFNIADSDISALEVNSKQMELDDLHLGIAKIEEDCSENCKIFAENIERDSQLLFTEKEELASLLRKKKDNVNSRLKKLAETDSHPDTKIFSKITIQSEFAPYLLSNKILMENGGARLYELSPSKYLLVSVGSTEVRANTAGDRIRQKKVAELSAMAHLLKMTGVKIYTRTIHTEEFSSAKDSAGKDKVCMLEQLFETTTETAEGFVRSLPVVGTWYSKDGTIFYTAIGKIIPRRKGVNHE